MNDASTMTRKQALAILYKITDAARGTLSSSQASEEMKVLGTQMYSALQVLTTAVHGKPQGVGHLCELCYLRYVPIHTPFVYLRDDPTSMKDLCTDCFDRLKAEGKIERLEHWMTGEVVPC